MPTSIRRGIIAIAAFAALFAVTPSAAHATRVCIQYLDGYRCETFTEPQPRAPGNTRGMKMTISPATLTSTNELNIRARRFQPGEIVRVWVYNIFGAGRMSELTNVQQANTRGLVAIAYAPSTTLYEKGWGRPAICMRGERSLRLACAQFTIADDSSSSVGAGSTTGTSPSTTVVPDGTNPTTTNSAVTVVPPGCVAMGDSYLCAE